MTEDLERAHALKSDAGRYVPHQLRLGLAPDAPSYHPSGHDNKVIKNGKPVPLFYPLRALPYLGVQQGLCPFARLPSVATRILVWLAIYDFETFLKDF